MIDSRINPRSSKSLRVLSIKIIAIIGFLGSLVCAQAGSQVVRSWQSKDGLLRENVESLAQTPEGYLWLATPAGLVRFDGRDFQTYHPFGPGLTNAPQMVITDLTGSLWVLSRSGEIKRRVGGRFVAVAQETSDPVVPARGLYSDGRGLLLASDVNGRIRRWDDGVLKPWLDSTDAAAEGGFVGINVDRSGHVYVRYGTTLSWWTGRGWERLADPEGTTNFVMTKTGASQEGGMWISGQEGLRRFRDGRWESVQLPYPRPVTAVQCLLEDRRGNLWLSTGNNGLWHFDNEGRFEVVDQPAGLPDDRVRQVFEDADGNVWVGSMGGLCLIREGGGNDPGDLAPNGVTLDRILADGVPLNSGSVAEADPIRVSRGTRRLELQMSAISFLAPEDVRLQYRMQDVDADWKLAGGSRTATYGNLPPGKHSFHLMASNAKGTGRVREAVMQVLVEPQVWQTWPFRGTMLALAVLAVLAVSQWRVTQLRRGRDLQLRFARQLIQSQEAERQRLAAELHDSLGQQLLVIKNNARLGLREHVSAAELRHQLELVSQTTSECIEDVRTMAYHLRPYQLDQIGLTKAIRALIEQVGQASGIRINPDLDELDGLLPSESEINLYRIVQEALNNVVRHADATEATVHIDHIGPNMTVRIQDNGRGLATEAPPGPAGGFGLNNIRERAALLGGTSELQSAPGRGVQLTVVFPLAKNAETPSKIGKANGENLRKPK